MLINKLRYLKRKISFKLKQIRGGKLHSFSNKFTELIHHNADIKLIATGFKFTEGPVWSTADHCLYFSDIPGNTIYKVGEKNKLSVFRQPSYHSNGLTFDDVGNLIVCEHQNRCVSKITKNGERVVLTESFNGKRFNSPNDVIVKSDGSIFFTDPPYGIKEEESELPYQGVYRFDPATKKTKLLIDDFLRPNGLAFSPDESLLYVDDSSERCHIRRFRLDHSGVPVKEISTMHLQSDKGGSPDGMKVDSEGNLYCTGPGGVWVFDNHGTHLGLIELPEQPSNCAWGEEEYKTLFITAGASVYKVKTNIKGCIV